MWRSCARSKMPNLKKSSKLELAASEGPITTRTEQKQVEERTAIGANIVYEAIRREGEDELNRPPSALAWSALAAGLSMGFSFIAEGLLMAHLPDTPWRPLISKLGYSVGFLIVILGRQQLFTENTLTVVLPLLVRKDIPTFVRMLRLWVIVLTSNLVGTFLFALALGKVMIVEPRVQACFSEIGKAHASGLGTTIMRSIVAGWLIALMVWLLPGAESSRISIIVILTYLIGIGGFNHVVAGSTTQFFLVVTGAITLGHYLAHFLLPVLMGNMLGGISLVAALGHAQVAGGMRDGARHDMKEKAA